MRANQRSNFGNSPLPPTRWQYRGYGDASGQDRHLLRVCGAGTRSLYTEFILSDVK
jgi:hypothetical protein